MRSPQYPRKFYSSNIVEDFYINLLLSNTVSKCIPGSMKSLPLLFINLCITLSESQM